MVIRRGCFASVLLIGLAVAAAPPRSPEKDRATAAFRAGHFAEACPRFEAVVQANRFDAWGLNDLALCRIRLGVYGTVLQALDKADALEKAVGEPDLAKAIAFNQTELAKALLAHPKAADVAAPALVLAKRATAANDAESGLALFELAVSDQTPSVVTLELDDWATLGALRIEKKHFAAGLEALLKAEEKGKPLMGSLPSVLPEVDTGTPWQERCVDADPSSFAKCGRRWLICVVGAPAHESTGYSQSSQNHGVLIDAKRLKQWRTEPSSETAPAGAWLSESSNSSDTRCPVPDFPMGALSSVGSETKIIGVDVCNASATVWSHDFECETNSYGVTTQALEPATPGR